MSWSKIEALKDLGGLEFGNIKIKNLGLIAKWWWNFSIDEGSDWKKVVKSTHSLMSKKAYLPLFSSMNYGTLREVVKPTKKLSWLNSLISDDLSLV